MDRIIVNSDIDPRNFRFPSRATLDNSFSVSEISLTEPSWTSTVWPAFRRGILAPLVSNPNLRTERAFLALNELDVELAKKHSNEASKKLREIFNWPTVGLQGK